MNGLDLLRIILLTITASEEVMMDCISPVNETMGQHQLFYQFIIKNYPYFSEIADKVEQDYDNFKYFDLVRYMGTILNEAECCLPDEELSQINNSDAFLVAKYLEHIDLVPKYAEILENELDDYLEDSDYEDVQALKDDEAFYAETQEDYDRIAVKIKTPKNN